MPIHYPNGQQLHADDFSRLRQWHAKGEQT